MNASMIHVTQMQRVLTTRDHSLVHVTTDTVVMVLIARVSSFTFVVYVII